MKRLLKLLKVVLPIGLAIYLMWYTFRDEEQREGLFAAMASADYLWIALSMLIALISHLARAKRWSYLMQPMGYKTRFWNAYHAVMIGYFVNMLIPRAGEVSRAEYFRRYEKIPLDRTIGTIAAERIIDLLAFAAVLALAVATQYEVLYAAIRQSLDSAQATDATAQGGIDIKYIIGAVVLVIGVVAVIKLGLVDKVKGFLLGILEGVKTIWTTDQKGPFIRETLVIWLCYLLMFGICYDTFPESSDLGLGAILAGFVFGTLAVIFTPGGTGAYHIAVAFALGYYGLDEQIGLALGLLLWASQLLLYITMGMISLILIGPYNKDYPGHAPHPS